MNVPILYPVEGGSINAAYQIITKNNAQWFSKINDSPAFPDLFEKESRGLTLLRQQDIFRIPAVVACETAGSTPTIAGTTTAGSTQILILEWINQGPVTSAFWHLFGEQLARLHRVSIEFPSSTAPAPTPSPDTGLTNNRHTATNTHSHSIDGSTVNCATPTFGLSWDNYMGALPQSNTPSRNWTDFFIQQRLDPQLRLAADKGLLNPAALHSFERLYKVLPAIFGEETPSLLHGDLYLPGGVS